MDIIVSKLPIHFLRLSIAFLLFLTVFKNVGDEASSNDKMFQKSFLWLLHVNGGVYAKSQRACIA